MSNLAKINKISPKMSQHKKIGLKIYKRTQISQLYLPALIISGCQDAPQFARLGIYMELLPSFGINICKNVHTRIPLHLGIGIWQACIWLKSTRTYPSK